MIASIAGSNPEVIGENGMLVDPDDEAEVVRAMQRVTTDIKFRDRLAKRGLTRAKSFTWPGFAKRVQRVIDHTSPRP